MTITQRLLLQLITQQEGSRDLISRMHRELQEQISSIPQNPARPLSRNVQVDNDPNKDAAEPTTNRPSDTVSIVFRHGKWGTFDAAYGPPRFFGSPKRQQPRGLGFRIAYTPPLWMFHLVLSIACAAGFTPRMQLDSVLHVAAVIPHNAEIFSLVMKKDLIQLRQLISSGGADARDQTVEGYTPLHVSLI